MPKRSKTPKKTPATSRTKSARRKTAGTTAVVKDPPASFVMALIVAYGCGIIAVNTPALMYPALQEAGILAPSDVAQILSVQVFGTLTGKLFAGFIVDGFGGRRTFMVCTACLGVLMSILPRVYDVWSTALLAFLVEVAFSPVYPSFVKFVTMWFPRASLGRGFWILSATSRGSYLFASSLYTYLLGFQDYTFVFYLTSVLSAIGFVVNLTFLGDAPFAKTYVAGGGLSKENVLEISSKAFSSKSFYLAVASYSLHNCIKRMGEIMGIYLLFQCSKLVNYANAPMWSSSFTVGVLVSVFGLGYFFQQMKAETKQRISLLMNLAGALCCFQLSYMSRSSMLDQCLSTKDLFVVAMLICFVGFSVGLTFYVPSGIFSVQFGGDKHSATVSSLMDILGSLCASASFFGIKYLLVSPWQWSGVWMCAGAISILNTVVSFLFLPIVWDNAPGKPVKKKTK